MEFQIYEKDDGLASVSSDGVLLSVAKLRKGFKNISFTLNDKEAEAFCEEFSIEFDERREFHTDVNTANNMIRHLFSIESAEVLASSENDHSERGKMAVRLIDIIHGSYDKSHDSKGENDEKL